MKRLFLSILLLSMPLAPMGWTGMTCKNNNQAAYQTIGATTAAVIAFNSAFLDSVVTGKTSTNNVPKVEAAFNDTLMALHTAAAVASGGTNAIVPLLVLSKATDFTNTVISVQMK